MGGGGGQERLREATGVDFDGVLVRCCVRGEGGGKEWATEIGREERVRCVWRRSGRE